jgi:large subunit ribosomal protein L3
MAGIIGKKVRMTQIFDDSGTAFPVTIISVGPCYVTQIKTQKKDGYDAVQLGYGTVKEKHVKSPLKGHNKKAGVKPLKHYREFTPFSEREIKLGDELKANIFSEGEIVEITGKSKGRGFQGVMKRHNFSGANKTHGQSDRWRAPGSIGQSSNPSRVFKGTKMPGRMGSDKITLPTSVILKIDEEKNLIFVKGPTPGGDGSLVVLKKKN